ncbi:hypothetical protein ACTHPW_18495 [Bacillus velezensis]|uniref:hypothetical protein n=1 Tax=Bacillus velezensis TaxID=492670 RepID=UPI003F7C11B2
MDVKIYIGNAECTACGRRHRKVFEIDGKPYGSSCANKIIGKELTAPVWLYELAETWFQDEMKRFQGDASKVDYEGIAVNFFNDVEDADANYDGQKIWSKSIKVNGKTVKVDWQYEINDYLKGRCRERIR